MIRHAFNEIRENPSVAALAAAGAAEGAYQYYLRPNLTAAKAWRVLAGLVVAYEMLCPENEMMSEGADRLIERHPFLTRLGGLVLAAHVLNLVKPEADIIHQTFIKLKGAT